MTETVKLINNAYLETQELIDKGYRTLPTHFRPIWERIKEGYAAVQAVPEFDGYDMYKVIYWASEEYNKTIAGIGIDNSFSTIICVMGIQIKSEKWYKIMSYHYAKQAERIDKEYRMWCYENDIDLDAVSE